MSEQRWQGLDAEVRAAARAYDRAATAEDYDGVTAEALRRAFEAGVRAMAEVHEHEMRLHHDDGGVVTQADDTDKRIARGESYCGRCLEWLEACSCGAERRPERPHLHHVARARRALALRDLKRARKRAQKMEGR